MVHQQPWPWPTGGGPAGLFSFIVPLFHYTTDRVSRTTKNVYDHDCIQEGVTGEDIPAWT